MDEGDVDWPDAFLAAGEVEWTWDLWGMQRVRRGWYEGP
jgi:hypothetical protein